MNGNYTNENETQKLSACYHAVILIGLACFCHKHSVRIKFRALMPWIQVC